VNDGVIIVLFHRQQVVELEVDLLSQLHYRELVFCGAPEDHGFDVCRRIYFLLYLGKSLKNNTTEQKMFKI
jgi:hypothetical protein